MVNVSLSHPYKGLTVTFPYLRCPYLIPLVVEAFNYILDPGNTVSYSRVQDLWDEHVRLRYLRPGICGLVAIAIGFYSQEETILFAPVRKVHSYA